MGANPTGLSREPRRDLYFFIHNVYANFFKDTLDYFSLHLMPQAEFSLISTYSKAVQYINQMCENDGKEMDKPNLPAVLLNPSGDFNIAEASSGGKFLWRHPHLAPGLIKRIFEPIYKDDNTQIHPGFVRMQGEMELLFLLNSFYEYCDIKMLLLNVFGGYERWIYPQFFTTFIILPEEMINYTYTNEYTGESNTLDWTSAGAYQQLVKTTNRNELVIPCKIKPIYKLMSLSDASNKYGAADDIAEWKLGATINYEIEIPTHLVLQSDYLFEQIDCKISAGSTFSVYESYEPPILNIRKSVFVNSFFGIIHKDTGGIVHEDIGGIVHKDIEISDGVGYITQSEEKEYSFHTRYFHTITQEQVDSTSNITISMPEQIGDINGLIVNSKYGKLEYGDHYILEDNGNDLTIKIDNVDLELGMVIEIFIYTHN